MWSRIQDFLSESDLVLRSLDPKTASYLHVHSGHLHASAADETGEACACAASCF